MVEEDEALGLPKQRHENWCRAMGQQWLCGDGGGFQGTMGVKEDSKDSFVCFCCWFVVGASSGAHVAYTKPKSHILCSSWCGMMCVCV